MTGNSDYKELLIGCGSRRVKLLGIEGHDHWSNCLTLDINDHHHPDIVWDLDATPYPFGSNTFDEIHAYEVLEHLGRQGDYVSFFDQFSEFWRILKPNGYLFATTPALHSAWLLSDPSHKRVITKESLIFLSQDQYAQVGQTAMSDYRYCYKADFRIVAACVIEDSNRFILQAIK